MIMLSEPRSLMCELQRSSEGDNSNLFLTRRDRADVPKARFRALQPGSTNAQHDMSFQAETRRRRTFAIISHP